MSFDRVKYMQFYHKNWYRKNKAQVDARNRKYAVDHVDEITRYKHNWFQKNKMRIGKKVALAHSRNPMARKRAVLKQLYSLSFEQYEAMVQQQRGLCAICGTQPKKRALDVDHNHKTKRVRGLLCSNCNRGLGMFQENVSLLRAAQVYLEKDQNYEN